MAERMELIIRASWLYRLIVAVEERSRAWFRGSLAGRLIIGVADAVTGSALLAWLLNLGAPTGVMRGSLLPRAVHRLIENIARPLSRVAGWMEGSALGRWWEGSLLSRLARYENGILFLLIYVPLSLKLTHYLPYVVKYAAEGVLLLMLARLGCEVLTGKKRLRWTDLDGPVLVWIAISLLSAVINRNGLIQSAAGLRAMFQYYLLALIISNAGFGRKQLRFMITVLFGLGAVLGLLGVYQWLAQVQTPAEWVDITERHITTRAFGTMANPNTFGGFLMIYAAPALALWTVTLPVRARAALIGGLPLILGAIAFTLSRSAWIALAVAILIIGIVQDRRILAALVAGALALPLISPTMVARLAQGFSLAYFTKSAAGGRIDWWTKAIDVAQLNPFFGVGPGQFGGAAANFFGTKANLLVNLPERFPLWVDSQIFQSIAETGYLGLIAFFWLFLTFFKIARDVYRKADETSGALVLGFAAAMVGVFAMSAFASMWEMQQISSLIWFGMGVTATIKRDGLREDG